MKEVRPLSEIQIQGQCFQLLWNLYPETRMLFFSVPNGGYRTEVESKQLQASGLVAGVSDTIFLWQEKGYAIEFKDDKGRQRPEQADFQQACATQNIPYHIVRTLDEFLNVVIPILHPELSPEQVIEKLNLIKDDQQKRKDTRFSRAGKNAKKQRHQ